jgi:SET domain-containing protein
MGNIEKYSYYYNNKYCMVAFGFCSMYNHKNNPNAKWSILSKDQMKIVALKSIRPGEEIFISYGSDYFKDLGITMK